MRCSRRCALLLPVALLVFMVTESAAQPVLTDAVYNAHHPRLLFTPAEIPALRAKVHDGGLDDDTYAYVRHVVDDIYPIISYTDVLALWYGEQAIPALGLVGHIESPPDSIAQALGKALTTYIADTYNADMDEANSGMRLRALVLGYDMCFGTAAPAERAYIRDEIVLYIQKMVWNLGYQLFESQPYLSNHSAMFGAALGMAAIVLQGETDAYLLSDALAMTDRIVDNLLEYQFDPEGAYNEGAFYAAWTLRNLVYYFDARTRYSGRLYVDVPQLRGVESWLAYELLPEGAGRLHNLNDSPGVSAPLAQHPTYFDWAMNGWNSGLSSWLWEHTTGDFGAAVAGDTDWTSTILWHRDIAPVQPGTVLPPSRIWPQRGLYYFRNGWPSGASSPDVVFNFYSGKFHGGHAQEDQNQFSLEAYGEKFAIDHGAGSIAKESEAHNMVFIDGQGQHNAGSSIGTDGRITEYLLGGLADFVVGDATDAYGTHSKFNNPHFPIYASDWSWGYTGANPVLFARRSVLVVHGDAIPPYVVVMDDIDKDGATHTYEWRMHTLSTNTVDTSSNPLTITGAAAAMDLHVMNPSIDSLSITTQPFNNGNSDPDATLLRIAGRAVNPGFAFLMVPRPNAVPAPGVTRQPYAWGYALTINWSGGVVDRLIRNDSGSAVSDGNITTDALVTLVRRRTGKVESYLATDVCSLSVGSTTYVSIANGPATCELYGSTIHIDRYDADFRFVDTGIDEVVYRAQQLGFVVEDGFVVPGGVTGVSDRPHPPGGLAVVAHPNPFNPGTTIRIDGDASGRTRAVIYDVAGRRVRLLWDGALGAASRSLAWDGRNDDGEVVASGTYFLKVVAPGATRSVKLTVLK